MSPSCLCRRIVSALPNWTRKEASITSLSCQVMAIDEAWFFGEVLCTILVKGSSLLVILVLMAT